MYVGNLWALEEMAINRAEELQRDAAGARLIREARQGPHGVRTAGIRRRLSRLRHKQWFKPVQWLFALTRSPRLSSAAAPQLHGALRLRAVAGSDATPLCP